MLVNMIGTLHLNVLSNDPKPLDLSSANQTYLLSIIRIDQGSDENLNKVAQNDKIEYQTSNNGTIVVNERIIVPNVKELKEEILKDTLSI